MYLKSLTFDINLVNILHLTRNAIFSVVEPVFYDIEISSYITGIIFTNIPFYLGKLSPDRKYYMNRAKIRFKDSVIYKFTGYGIVATMIGWSIDSGVYENSIFRFHIWKGPIYYVNGTQYNVQYYINSKEHVGVITKNGILKEMNFNDIITPFVLTLNYNKVNHITD